MRQEQDITSEQNVEELSPINQSTRRRIQAQVERFADQDVKNFSQDQSLLLRHSAELANVKDLNNLPANLPEQLTNLVHQYRGSYLQALRRERASGNKMSLEQENIKTYEEKFQATINELKARILLGAPKELPEYLGSGSNGSAFRIEVDGKAYAAKFSKNVTQANFEIKPLILAKGVPHTAQLVSYSFADSAVIMRLLPGTDVTQLSAEEVPKYSDDEIIQLIETVKELDSKGLVIDPKASNFMYDRQQGFSILDYHVKNTSSYELPQQIIDLRLALTKRKIEKLDYVDEDFDIKYKQQSVERNRIFLPMMIRFLGILQNKYPEILSAWQTQHAANKANPNMRVSEIIDRTSIPQVSEFLPYLKKLEEMGF